MLITQGGRFAGYGFYLLKGKPVFLWNLVDLKRVRWEGPELTPGKHVLEFDFKYDGLGAGHAGVRQLCRRRPGRHRRAQGRRQGGRHGEDGAYDAVHPRSGTRASTSAPTPAPAVDDKDYQVPFTFTGKINKITLTIDRPKLSPDDIKKLEAGAAQQQGERVAGNRPPRKIKSKRGERHMKRVLAIVVALTAAVVMMAAPATAQQPFEAPPALSAKYLLPPEMISGPLFRVDEQVPTDGLRGLFTLRSDLGTSHGARKRFAQDPHRRAAGHQASRRYEQDGCLCQGSGRRGYETGRRCREHRDGPGGDGGGAPRGASRASLAAWRRGPRVSPRGQPSLARALTRRRKRPLNGWETPPSLPWDSNRSGASSPRVSGSTRIRPTRYLRRSSRTRPGSPFRAGLASTF